MDFLLKVLFCVVCYFDYDKDAVDIFNASTLLSQIISIVFVVIIFFDLKFSGANKTTVSKLQGATSQVIAKGQLLFDDH